MQKCKKYKPSANHHLNPQGDCHGCVYFTKLNCGMHPQGDTASPIIT